jgi:hypothetical protein
MSPPTLGRKRSLLSNKNNSASNFLHFSLKVEPVIVRCKTGKPFQFDKMRRPGNSAYCAKSLKSLNMILQQAVINVSGRKSNSRVGYASHFCSNGVTKVGMKYTAVNRSRCFASTFHLPKRLRGL